MNPKHWMGIAALAVVVLFASMGCGGNAPAATNKRLGDQKPCDLVKVENLEKVFGRLRIPPPIK